MQTIKYMVYLMGFTAVLGLGFAWVAVASFAA